MGTETFLKEGAPPLPGPSALNPRQKQPAKEPLLVVLGVALSVFLSQGSLTFLLERLPPLSPWLEALVEASGLVVVVSPVLYFLTYRPLLRRIRHIKAMEASLRLSRRRLKTQSTFLRRIIDTDPNLIFVKNWDGKFVLVNQAVADLYGTTVEDLIGKGDADFNPKAEEVERFLMADREVMASGSPELIPEEPVSSGKAGGTRWFQTLKVPLVLPGSQERMVLGVATDITERRQAEEGQKARTKQILRHQAALVELSKTQAADLKEAFRKIVRADALTLDVERVSLWLFNEDRSALVCRTLFKRTEDVYEEGACLEVKKFPRYFNALAENRFIAADDAHEDAQTSEFKDSYLAPLNIRSMMDAPIRRQGELIGVVCHEHVGKPRSWTLEDREFAGAIGDFVSLTLEVEDRRRAETKIREQAALLDLTRDAVLVRAMDGRVLFWNKGAGALYGWTAEEMLGKNADPLLFKNESHALLEARRRTLERGEWSGPFSQAAKDGRAVLVESRWTLVKGEAGEPKAILEVNTDVTEKKKIEEINLRNQRIESIGTLAGGIAHDLNNVLAPILMAISILRRKMSDPQGLEFLSVLETSTSRGVDMVKQILTFSRGAKGERVPLSVGPLMREMEKMVRETFPKSIETALSVSGELLNVMGDATQLQQVLLNLCVNARDAMPRGGKIALTAENAALDQNLLPPGARPGAYVRVRIADTGDGIPPEVMPKIFDPFFTTKEPGKGTGIGLSTVAGIVKSHGGFLKVYSEPGKGTEFSVYLPAVAASLTEAVSPEADKIPTGQGQKILVVDDESSIREISRAMLQTYGYHAVTAEDGSEAVALFAKTPASFSAVLLDMNMPVMDGLQALRALQKIDPKVRVIATSGLKTYEDLVKTGDGGVKAFLQKPYAPEKLLKTLKDVVATK
jgi:PAS domain S-box-containing protein